MSPLPWPLIGRPHATGGTITPAPVRGPIAVAEPPGEATATRYLDPDRPGTGHPAPLWLIAESAVLHRLAERGGDLTAHRTIHMPPGAPEQAQTLRAVEIDRDEWRRRAHHWRATAGPPEDSDEYDLDTDPDALRRNLNEVIEFLEGRPAKMVHDAVWARVRPVLRIHREKLAEQRQRAEEAERQRDQARDAIADERRGKLAAEAANRRVRESP